MIDVERLIAIGEILKPHGINGELSATIDSDADAESLSCIFLKVDGLFVPFFVEGIRRRGAEGVLLTIDGIDTEIKAKAMSRKEIFVLDDDPAAPARDDSDGFYAEDLIGFEILTDGGERIGEIMDVDDSTANVLFIVGRADGSEALIPVADEFILSLDPESKQLTMKLPDGLLS